VTTLRTAFPDLLFAIDEEVAEENKVAVRFTVQGIHKGDYMGIAPTGKHVSYSAVDIFVFNEGKIAEVWSLSDQLSLMQQLGAVPSHGRES
jgi:steroid delta-isomerase-like uncharacterized protein